LVVGVVTTFVEANISSLGSIKGYGSIESSGIEFGFGRDMEKEGLHLGKGKKSYIS
jgi:hypothetical protein